MSESIVDRYLEQLVVERPEIARARRDALELGVDPVSPATGAALAQFAAAMQAQTIIELGTGLGVSGLWLLAGAPAATLTSIDSDFEVQQAAKERFQAAGIPAAKVRLITGRAAEVLPRMNDGSYDLVVIDADPIAVIEYVEHALRIVRPGGTVLVPHALWRGRVADPVARDETTVAFRDLIDTVLASEAVTSAVHAVGDGLLAITRNG